MSLAAVHLVRHGNPDAWLDGFLTSYRHHDAGIAHDLVIILKGFETPLEMRTRIGVVAPEVAFIEIDDSGFDINAYRHAAGALPHERLCFLNSHSRIEGPGWLAALAAALEDTGIGGVGASGSWEAMDATTPFPNVHLRTTGFLVDRQDFLALDFGPLATKRDCNRFEAGPASMTQQLRSAGREVAIVGRDGRVFAPENWPDSRTFRGGDQENLLISDNRTRAYDRALTSRRRKLARLAWDDRARPARKPIVRAIAERLGL